MSSRTETWVAGIVGVAVGALLAVAIFLISQPPAAREQATGAIGAAERFRTEQIKEGDTGISGTLGSAGQFTAVDFAAVLGRVGSDLRVEALNQATLEQQAAMFGNADVLEKVNGLSRVDATMQKQIMEKMKVGERKAIERLAGSGPPRRARPPPSTPSRLAPGERFDSLNRATLEQQAALFAKFDALEKAVCYGRLDATMQRQIVERMGPYERADFERALNERVVRDRMSSERVGQERVGNQRAVEE